MPQAAPTPQAPARPLHIFKPGRWTTMHGESIEFSQADLQAMAQAYDPKLSKAPLVVGHPKTDDPAKGWAVQLTANERGLYATADKVDPQFAEAVRRGAYGTVSAKFYRPTDPGNPTPGVWYLRHIGFLGAQPPAVKGLDAPEFAGADGDGGVCFQEGVAFGEWDAMTAATLWRNLREWLVGKFGLDEADKVLPGYNVRALELGAAEDINHARQAVGQSAAFAQPADLPAGPADSPTPPPPQESAVTDQEAAQLREQNAALQRQNDELLRAAQARAVEAIRQDNVAFAEGLAAQARIPAAMTAQVAAIGAQLQSTPDVEFGEGDAARPLHQVFRELLQALPPAVEFGETATRQRAADGADATTNDDPAFAEADPDRLAQHTAALAYAKKHGVPYAQAAAAVVK